MVDKKTKNIMLHKYTAVDEKFAAYRKEQQELERRSSGDTGTQEEIQAQIRKCADAEAAWVKEREKADNYVRCYMKCHDVDSSVKKMEELINVMPDCFFRYLLFRRMQDMKRVGAAHG